MSEVTFIVTLTVDGDKAEMIDLFGQYLTTEGFPLHDDYGLGWGGYEGPWITHVEVSAQGGGHFSSNEWIPDKDFR